MRGSRTTTADRRAGANPVGKTGALVWPFLAAIVVSSVLSLKYLAPQRQRFADVVQARAEKATSRFEEMRAKEDED
jgi:hypothetical protein